MILMAQNGSTGVYKFYRGRFGEGGADFGRKIGMSTPNFVSFGPSIRQLHFLR